MNKLQKIHIRFIDNYGITFDNHNLKEIAENLLEGVYSHSEPLLITLNDTQKLYFEKSEFSAFVNNDFDIEELIENQSTDGLYRNKEAFNLGNGIFIDPLALWSQKDNRMFLLDDDRNIITNFSLVDFKAI